MTTIVWELEWRIARTRRRLFLLNVLVPLLMVTSIAVGGAPRVHAAAVYAVLFAIFGTFGSAIPLVRDLKSGLVGRVLRGGVPAPNYLLQRSAASAMIDVLQLSPALAAAAVGAGATPRGFGMAFVALTGTVWVASLIGCLVAAVTESLAEAALFSAMSTLLLLHGSGVFRTPVPGSIGAVVEAWAPFRALHEALLSMGMSTPIEGGVSLALWSTVLGVAIGVLVAGRFARS